MVIPSPELRDGTTKSWTRLEAEQTQLAQVGSDVATKAPDGILRQGQWLWIAKGPLSVAVVVVCSQSYWVDPYRLAKITKNRVRLENRSDWAVFRSDVTVVSSDGILRQGQRLLTPNSPPEVAVSQLYGPKCGLSSGPALRIFGLHGLGVSTFP
ncbi:hypothetical protein CRG98_018864 [Punica granatum]|uniref:Uncharacterized protein n=1 Tax=Punica granatum TaxID=22663 RepID=A0A2I0JWR1_PUNGR|nr:hypothetical protein CRG98_018864 [Punica granatum]